MWMSQGGTYCFILELDTKTRNLGNIRLWVCLKERIRDEVEYINSGLGWRNEEQWAYMIYVGHGTSTVLGRTFPEEYRFIKG